MKVKDVERTANIAWSPQTQPEILLACGTAAQQLDASFNTNAALELYSLNLSEPGPDMLLKSTCPSEQRFHRVIWGPYGTEEYGTIIGGCDGGLIKIYNASKLLTNENALICAPVKHQGPVHALDFNPFQKNLFATGAGESEIFIWDLNKINQHMTPEAKSQPPEDVLFISWNRQVQHILASTFASKCVIWDLRKNEPIIKLTDTVSRVRWKVVAWHPEVATQLCLASEEDHSPIIQLWDLRFATSPLKTLENHQRGVLSIAWNNDDADLLVSCGKDDRILAWNPNSAEATGEVLAEVAKTPQWSFDVQWCPRNPALIACPNFDGHIHIYSIMGGKTQQIQTSNKIADSFPGMEGYVEAPIITQTQQSVSYDLSKAPKWLKRPVGARFGFGGKLVTFEAPRGLHVQPGQVAPSGINRSVEISQVITEPELVRKSAELEQALEYGNFIDYCNNKAEWTDDQHKKYIWHFLRANFNDNPRAELLNLLGYRIEDINNKLNHYLNKQNEANQNHLNQVDQINNLDPFEKITEQMQKATVAPFKIKTGDDTEGLISQALLLGNVEAAVELCLKAKRFADAIIIAMTGGTDLLARTQHAYLDQCEGYVSSLIAALVSEDWATVINNCDLSSWKEALAATLTHSTDDVLPILCEQLGNRLEIEANNDIKLKQDSQLCYICSGSFEKLVMSWSGNAQNSTDDLQELVELVMFLQKSIERQGRQVQISGALADLLSHYASLLASQGNLSTALTYLGDSQDVKVAELRDRLNISLGHKPLYGRPQPVQSRRSSSNRTSFSSYPNIVGAPPTALPPQQFNTGLPGQVIGQQTQPWQPIVPPPTSGVVGAPPPLSVTSNAQTLAQQAPRVFSPGPVAPPRPPSVGAQHSGGLPSRKYVLDPSVTSNPYGAYQQPPMGAPYQPQPLQPAAQAPAPFVPAPIAAPAPFIPAPTMGMAAHAPTAAVPPFGAQEIGQPAMERPRGSFSSSAPGWNDPPVLNRAPRPQAKVEPGAQQPITHPLYGSAPAPNAFPPTNNGYDNAAPPMNLPPNYGSPLQQDGGAIPASQFYQPQLNNNNYTAAPPTFSPGNFKANAISTGVNAQPQQQQQRPEPQIIEKPPIPEEHVHMKTVFDELKYQCSCAANNPQTKRKLEDVGRKLESLYDLLREHKLSSNTLASLHQMVQLVQDGNYTGGLALHTQLVSGPDFAQIASFMPGLKVLLQCALQLQVYIR